MTQPVQKTVLDNGIRILTKQMPHVRSASMGVWVNAGARDETAEEGGLSHFIEHMIFKGTRTRSAYRIAKEFDAIGGHSNAFTTMEHTCYHAKVLDSHIDTMVDILSDIFLNSVFDPVEIEKERPVIFQEIDMVEDSPEEMVHLMSGRAFWGEHPLGRSVLGTKENMLRFDADIIKTFFRRLYQPDRIILSAAGNIDHARFVDLVAPLFETIARLDGFPERRPPRTVPQVVVTRKPLEQVHLCLATQGLPSAHPDRFAFSLANTLLGGNMSSRLFQEIRERRGLAYAVYSFVSSHTDAGMFGAYTAVDPRNMENTVSLVLGEMARFRDTAVDDGDLRDAKEYTKGSLLLASESVDNQMVRLAQNEIHFGEYIPMAQVVDQVEAVSAEDIRSLCERLFQSGALSMAVVGPVDETAALDGLLRFP